MSCNVKPRELALMSYMYLANGRSHSTDNDESMEDRPHPLLEILSPVHLLQLVLDVGLDLVCVVYVDP